MFIFLCFEEVRSPLDIIDVRFILEGSVCYKQKKR
jgi:hypothetical protein